MPISHLQGHDLNGLAEVMLSLALNNPQWINERLLDVADDKCADAVELMRAAINRIPIEISILVTSEDEAKTLEDEMIEHYKPQLLNRAVRRNRDWCRDAWSERFRM